MNILISTNLYRASEFECVFALTDKFREEQVGVEVFSMFHQECFEGILERSMRRLSVLPVSFHGPYGKTEHSAPKGTEEYERSMQYFRTMLFYAKQLNCRYAVFHHNNCRIEEEEKQKRLETAEENLLELREMCREAGIPLAVENAGVKSVGNMLLDEEEFTARCRKYDGPVLIDIGHANANGWNLRRVMETLSDRIIAYHIHNNDGFHDNHRRMYDGTLEFDRFLKDVQELTPDADLVLEYSPDVQEDIPGIREDIRTLCRFREKR